VNLKKAPPSTYPAPAAARAVNLTNNYKKFCSIPVRRGTLLGMVRPFAVNRLTKRSTKIVKIDRMQTH
jgi:hypothetical protein